MRAFVSVCRDWQVPYIIERSRSGNGAHVWIIFEKTISAYKARRLGNAIMTEATNREGRMNLNSYDRFFPNQDTMPQGGFGNLVALPLQGQARKKGNSVFVDEEFLPIKDQWSYLYHIKKVSESFVDVILLMHPCEELGRLTTSSEQNPWVMPSPENIVREDFASKITLTKADMLYVPIKSISSKVMNHLKRIAAFKNPEFYRNQQMRLPTYNIPRIISCAEVSDDYVAIPRGCEDAVTQLMHKYKVQVEIEDKTNHGSPVSVTFKGKERPEQLEAIDSLLKHNCGVLSATTAFGKTVTAAAMIARKKVNTLILVHTKALLAQWKSRLEEYLNIDFTLPELPKKRGRKKVFSPIGSLDSTGNSLHGVIDIALIQSCFDNGEVKPFVRDYGMVIVDECHHVSSITFENVMKRVLAHSVYGLTATPIRKDGHQPIIFMQCGPIRYCSDAKRQIQKQSFKRYLVPRFTSFRTLSNDNLSFTALCEALAGDEVRNKLIVEDVVKAVQVGRTPIVLTSRTSHVELLAKLIGECVKNVIQLTGAGSTKEKREMLARLQSISADEPLVIVATGKYVGEGFDYPRLDTLFLTLPISWKGLVAQYAGRLHRENEGKKDVRIYDYIDIHVQVCDNMYRKRLKGYASIGYQTVSKASASLFDAMEEFDVSSKEEQIFNGRDFSSSFSGDLTAAKHSILIASPKLNKLQKNKLIQILKSHAADGLEVIILSKQRNDQTAYLESMGLSVRIIPNLSLCAAIIDKSTVWYGSINPLGYANEEDNAIRLKDAGIANEMMNIVLTEMCDITTTDDVRVL